MRTQVRVKQKEFEEAVAKSNMTYKELAKRLKINRVYLSNLKNEKTPEFRPGGSLRLKIMKILNVGFDDIFKVVRVKEK